MGAGTAFHPRRGWGSWPGLSGKQVSMLGNWDGVAPGWEVEGLRELP